MENNFIETAFKEYKSYNTKEKFYKNSIKAKNIYFTTHASKFSHPESKTSNINFFGIRENDGFLRSGNVVFENDIIDCSCNASDIPLYRILLTKINNKTILQHLQECEQLTEDYKQLSENDYPKLINENGEWFTNESTNNFDIRKIFNFETEKIFQSTRNNLLQSIKNDNDIYTHRLVKQVFFPVHSNDDKYHILSILTPSLIIYEMKQRIKKFAKNTKIFGTHTIKYGGSQAQNISIINLKGGGRFFLLLSVPPSLPPFALSKNNDFISYSFRMSSVTRLLTKLCLSIEANDTQSVHVIISQILSLIIFQSHKARTQNAGWSTNDTYKHLPAYQKIWLDDMYIDMRHENKGWLQEVILGIAQNIFYKCDKDLSDDVENYITDVIRRKMEELK